MKFSLRIVAFTLAALTASAFAQEAVVLKEKIKEGTAISFKTVANISMSFGEGTMTASLNTKVVKVDEKGGYTLESTMEGKAAFGGQEFPIKNTSKSVYSADNMLTSVSGDEMNEDTTILEFRTS